MLVSVAALCETSPRFAMSIFVLSANLTTNSNPPCDTTLQALEVRNQMEQVNGISHYISLT